MSSFRIGIIDDDAAWLDSMRRSFKERVGDMVVDTFLYPDNLNDFCEQADSFDFLIIEHNLGGSNGANLARRLLLDNVQGKIIIVASNGCEKRYGEFKFLIGKDKLKTDPECIFDVHGDTITQAVETSVLMQAQIKY